MPLAAIGPAAFFLGQWLFGVSAPLFAGDRMPVGPAFAAAVVRYVLSLAGVWVVALVIDALAPTFHGRKNPIQALKVAVYSSTAAWLAGIFGLVPALAVLGILGLYSLYLLYVGLTILMKCPPQKALGYTMLVVLAAVVVLKVIAFATLPLPRGPVASALLGG